jgi:hypothetical protein
MGTKRQIGHSRCSESARSSDGGPWRTRTSDPLIKSLRTLTPQCNPLQANSAIELHFALSKLG